MGSSRTRTSRRPIAVTLAVGLVVAGVVSANRTAAHPEHDAQQEGGVGVLVNAPEELAGFRPAVHWSGTADVDDQTADLVYAGTGCGPIPYQFVDVSGRIAIVEDQPTSTIPGDVCPSYTFFQKAQAAEEAGAIGLVQVRRDNQITGRNAVSSSIPVLELPNREGQPILDAVQAETTVNATLTRISTVPTERLSDVPCVDGMAGPFPCDGIDLLGFVPHTEFDSAGISDIWGWTDPDTGEEYVILGKTNGIAFFRVTDPTDAAYLGELPNPAQLQAVWHDLKVHDNHVFTVSESEQHGMTVFDLTRLRGVTEPQGWDADAHFTQVANAHNIAINTDTGFAYVVGGNTGIVMPDECLSGLFMVDISTPTDPTFAGCYLEEGGPGTAFRTIGEPATELSPAAYVHDTQCVIYDGPDERYTGNEICFNAAEDKIVIADVTNKDLPVTVGVTDYPDIGYAHQGWLTEDHAYLITNDELDEVNAIDAETGEPGMNTRTLVFDVSDLENPTLHFEHFHDTVSSDHNLYVHEGLVYLSNYASGLRVLDAASIDDPDDPRLEPVAFFDTFPDHDNPGFDGTWSNYPFFESGTIAVSGRAEGLFLLRLQGERVERLGGPTRIETAISISEDSYADGAAAVVILARDDDFADALSGTPLGVAEDGPLLLTRSDELLPAVAAEIQRVLSDDGRIYLLGGEAALDDNVWEQTMELGFPQQRLAGPTRVETAIEISRQLGDPALLLLATGAGFADALTAAAAAGANGGAVLLTSGDQAHPQVDAYLADRDVDLYAIGGPAVRAYPDAQSVAGPTRDTTAVAVAETFFEGPTVAALARLDDFPDALTGGRHVGSLGGPLLLTATDAVPGSAMTYLCGLPGLHTVYVYGGEAAVSAGVVDALEAMLATAEGCGAPAS